MIKSEIKIISDLNILPRVPKYGTAARAVLSYSGHPMRIERN